MHRLISSAVIKHFRESRRLTQKQVYSGLCDSSTYSRIEKGEQNPSAALFIALMERLGIDCQKFYMNIQSVKEYYQIEEMHSISRLLRDFKFDEAKERLDSFKTEYGYTSETRGGKPGEQEMPKRLKEQFILSSEAILESYQSEDLDAVLKKLQSAITLTIPDFEETKINAYLLSSEEVVIINSMAATNAMLERYDKTIEIYYQLKENMDKFYINEAEKVVSYPMILYNLTSALGITGKYAEAIGLCDIAIRYCREYNYMILLPRIMYNRACGYYYTGDMDTCLTISTEAYYCARAHGDFKMAEHIKEKTKERLNIDIHKI